MTRFIKITENDGVTRTVTREEFIARWEIAESYFWLAKTADDVNTLDRIQDEIAAMASRRFDELYHHRLLADAIRDDLENG